MIKMKNYGITKLYRLSKKCYERKMTIFSKIIKVLSGLFFLLLFLIKQELVTGQDFLMADMELE